MRRRPARDPVRADLLIRPARWRDLVDAGGWRAADAFAARAAIGGRRPMTRVTPRRHTLDRWPSVSRPSFAVRQRAHDDRAAPVGGADQGVRPYGDSRAGGARREIRRLGPIGGLRSMPGPRNFNRWPPPRPRTGGSPVPPRSLALRGRFGLMAHRGRRRLLVRLSVETVAAPSTDGRPDRARRSQCASEPATIARP